MHNNKNIIEIEIQQLGKRENLSEENKMLKNGMDQVISCWRGREKSSGYWIKSQHN